MCASTLARFEVIGSVTDRGTDGIAAWWSTYSQPSTALLAKVEISQIAFEEFHAGNVVEIAALSGDERIGDPDAMAAPDQFL